MNYIIMQASNGFFKITNTNIPLKKPVTKTSKTITGLISDFLKLNNYALNKEHKEIIKACMFFDFESTNQHIYTNNLDILTKSKLMRSNISFYVEDNTIFIPFEDNVHLL